MSEELSRPRGRNGGRKPRLSPEQVAEARQMWATRTMTLQQIGDQLGGIAKSTVYDYVKTPPQEEK